MTGSVLLIVAMIAAFAALAGALVRAQPLVSRLSAAAVETPRRKRRPF